MSRDIPNHGTSRTVSFRKITESFLICKGLPFDKVLSEEKIVDIFSKHNNLFATRGIYSTAVVLWAFLGQALRDGKAASDQFYKHLSVRALVVVIDCQRLCRNIEIGRVHLT